MIICDKVEVLINKKNLKFYSKLGYSVKLGEAILIPLSDISLGSHVIVDVKCDYCGSEKKLSYKNYNKSIKTGGKYACSQKCSYIKKSEFLLQKEGIENIFQSQVIKDKIKQSNIDKWGVESYIQSNDFREKYRKINLERYGVENPMQSKEIKERVKKTCVDKWGGIGFASDLLLEKVKSTNVDRFGIENPCQLDVIKERIRNTTIENWGGIGFESEEIFNKIKKTTLKRYGTDSNTKNEEFRKLYYKLSQDINYIEYIGDRMSVFSCDKGHTFSIHKDNYYSRKSFDIPMCTVCNPIGEVSSFKEMELFDFIKSLNIEVIPGYRDGFEIDIFLPNHNIGIEFNGLYYHSDIFKEKNYHIEKTNYFNYRDIRLIHIWEDDWVDKKEIIKSQIRNILNLSNKIWARKCQVRNVEFSICQKFLDENHIQGSYNSIQKSLGLYYNNDLVSIMCFDHFEGRKKMLTDEWNLSRFCNRRDYSVIGGASKLLVHFIKMMSPKRIISYADKDWSIGNLYEKLKFVKLYETKPDYKYILQKKRKHKSIFRKSRTNMSEAKLCLPKVYDCGKIKYERIFSF